jgi:hypothetical protein
MAKARLKIVCYYDLSETEDRDYKSKNERKRWAEDRKAFESGDLGWNALMRRCIKEGRDVKWRFFTDEQFENRDVKSNRGRKTTGGEKAEKPAAKGGAVTKKALHEAAPAKKKKSNLNSVLAEKRANATPAAKAVTKKAFHFVVKGK